MFWATTYFCDHMELPQSAGRTNPNTDAVPRSIAGSSSRFLQPQGEPRCGTQKTYENDEHQRIRFPCFPNRQELHVESDDISVRDFFWGRTEALLNCASNATKFRNRRNLIRQELLDAASKLMTQLSVRIADYQRIVKRIREWYKLEVNDLSLMKDHAERQQTIFHACWKAVISTRSSVIDNAWNDFQQQWTKKELMRVRRDLLDLQYSFVVLESLLRIYGVNTRMLSIAHSGLKSSEQLCVSEERRLKDTVERFWIALTRYSTRFPEKSSHAEKLQEHGPMSNEIETDPASLSSCFSDTLKDEIQCLYFEKDRFQRHLYRRYPQIVGNLQKRLLMSEVRSESASPITYKPQVPRTSVSPTRATVRTIEAPNTVVGTVKPQRSSTSLIVRNLQNKKRGLCFGEHSFVGQPKKIRPERLMLPFHDQYGKRVSSASASFKHVLNDSYPNLSQCFRNLHLELVDNQNSGSRLNSELLQSDHHDTHVMNGGATLVPDPEEEYLLLKFILEAPCTARWIPSEKDTKASVTQKHWTTTQCVPRHTPTALFSADRQYFGSMRDEPKTVQTHNLESRRSVFSGDPPATAVVRRSSVEIRAGQRRKDQTRVFNIETAHHNTYLGEELMSLTDTSTVLAPCRDTSCVTTEKLSTAKPQIPIVSLSRSAPVVPLTLETVPDTASRSTLERHRSDSSEALSRRTSECIDLDESSEQRSKQQLLLHAVYDALKRLHGVFTMKTKVYQTQLRHFLPEPQERGTTYIVYLSHPPLIPVSVCEFELIKQLENIPEHLTPNHRVLSAGGKTFVKILEALLTSLVNKAMIMLVIENRTWSIHAPAREQLVGYLLDFVWPGRQTLHRNFGQFFSIFVETRIRHFRDTVSRYFREKNKQQKRKNDNKNMLLPSQNSQLPLPYSPVLSLSHSLVTGRLGDAAVAANDTVLDTYQRKDGLTVSRSSAEVLSPDGVSDSYLPVGVPLTKNNNVVLPVEVIVKNPDNE